MANIQDTAPVMAAKVALARTVALSSGRAGHGGTTLPGRVVRSIDPGIIGRLSARLKEGCLVVSATNGKTTTCAMIAGVLAEAGLKVARNREGANLAAGVATALLRDTGYNGRLHSDIGLYETDEAVFPEVAAQSRPRAVLLMNLFRDQLDRYGELESIAGKWREAVSVLPDETLAVLNADDPLVAGMAALHPGKTLLFGIEDESAGGAVMQHASDSKYCTECGTPYEYEVLYMGHLGKYQCPRCGLKRPSPTVTAKNIRLEGMAGSRFDLATPAGELALKLPLPGLYNIYNALAAAAICTGIGIGAEAVAAGLSAFSAAFGRVEQLVVEGRRVCLLLVKNPAGFNEVVRTLLIEPGQKHLLVALNDRIADGRDISWIWDVDLETLAGGVESAVCTGTRAEEMAMRLKYAGFPVEGLKTVPELRTALSAALERTPEDETLYILPTYTAMLALRQIISQHFQTDRQMGDLVWK